MRALVGLVDGLEGEEGVVVDVLEGEKREPAVEVGNDVDLQEKDEEEAAGLQEEVDSYEYSQALHWRCTGEG